MDPLDALRSCGGAARVRRLRELGVPARALQAAVRSGTVRALGLGGYALPEAPPGLVAAARLGGVASHATAAGLHGFPLWNPVGHLAVTVPHGSTRALAEVKVYRADLDPGDLDPRRACTSPLRTAIDCARTLPLVDAVCVLDAALHSCAVTVHQLEEAARTARGPGAAKLRRAVAHADARAESPLESALRVLLVTAGFRVRSQVFIPGVGTVDLVVESWPVVEADGYEFHSDRRAYRTDRGRGNELTACGRPLLRFTWEDVRARPQWVVAQVRRVVAQQRGVAG